MTIFFYSFALNANRPITAFDPASRSDAHFYIKYRPAPIRPFPLTRVSKPKVLGPSYEAKACESGD